MPAASTSRPCSNGASTASSTSAPGAMCNCAPSGGVRVSTPLRHPPKLPQKHLHPRPRDLPFLRHEVLKRPRRHIHPTRHRDVIRPIMIHKTPRPNHRTLPMRNRPMHRHRPRATKRHLPREDHLDCAVLGTHGGNGIRCGVKVQGACVLAGRTKFHCWPVATWAFAVSARRNPGFWCPANCQKPFR